MNHPWSDWLTTEVRAAYVRSGITFGDESDPGKIFDVWLEERDKAVAKETCKHAEVVRGNE